MSPLTFAIGDVHGCLDMLQSLLGACEAHAAGRPARYVFLVTTSIAGRTAEALSSC